VVWCAERGGWPQTDGGGGGGSDENLAALILAQLRWLDHIVSSGDLVKTVLEVNPTAMNTPHAMYTASAALGRGYRA
jgi:hypothetical protein